MSVGQWIAIALLVSVGGYVIYRIKTINNIIARLQDLTTTAIGYNTLIEQAILSLPANTEAMRENTKALQELIALNKQLLDRQNEHQP